MRRLKVARRRCADYWLSPAAISGLYALKLLLATALVAALRALRQPTT